MAKLSANFRTRVYDSMRQFSDETRIKLEKQRTDELITKLVNEIEVTFGDKTIPNRVPMIQKSLSDLQAVDRNRYDLCWQGLCRRENSLKERRLLHLKEMIDQYLSSLSHQLKGVRSSLTHTSVLPEKDSYKTWLHNMHIDLGIFDTLKKAISACSTVYVVNSSAFQNELTQLLQSVETRFDTSMSEFCHESSIYINLLSREREYLALWSRNTTIHLNVLISIKEFFTASTLSFSREKIESLQKSFLSFIETLLPFDIDNLVTTRLQFCCDLLIFKDSDLTNIIKENIFHRHRDFVRTITNFLKVKYDLVHNSLSQPGLRSSIQDLKQYIEPRAQFLPYLTKLLPASNSAISETNIATLTNLLLNRTRDPLNGEKKWDTRGMALHIILCFMSGDLLKAKTRVKSMLEELINRYHRTKSIWLELRSMS
jgi:hypothetical protein